MTISGQNAPAGSGIRGLSDLPPFPGVAVRLMRLASTEGISLRNIAEMVRADAAVSADVLRLANSSMFGGRTEVVSILHALAMLGLDRVKAMVTTAALRRYVASVWGYKSFVRCWRHNLACALVSQELAAQTTFDPDFAYTSGLLHKIGCLALLVSHPSEYGNLISSAESDPDLRAKERAALGIDHRVAGKWLIQQWKLPDILLQAVGHQPAQDAETLDLAGLVDAACVLAGSIGFPLTTAVQEAQPAGSGVNEQALAERVALKMNSLECSLMF